MSTRSLVVVTAAFALATLAQVGPARAQVHPKLRVIDHGAEVEVLVTGVRMVAAPMLTVNRQRLEVVLFGRPDEVMDTFADHSVERVDVRGLEPRRAAPLVLSVKLRGDHARAVALLPGARAIQGDDGVHVWIPRAVPVAAAVTAPTTAAQPVTAAVAAPAGAAIGTTATVAGASPAAALTPNLTPNLKPNLEDAAGTASADRGPLVDPHATSTAAANPTAATAAATSLAPPTPAQLTGQPSARSSSARSPSARLTGGSGGPGLGRVVIAIAVIGLVGLAAMMLRRRRAATPITGPQLEVLATRELGGKTRVVWLGAGERELVVSVAGQQVRLLGQWRRGDADRSAPLSLDAGRDDAEPLFAHGSSPMPRVRGNATAAVSGIMRLRGKVTPITDDVATGDSDADEQWARDILAATGGRR